MVEGGNPVNFGEPKPPLSRRRIRLIEDYTHTHGSEWRGRRVGAIGGMG
ncbi:hypothetical protein HRbin02_00695 [Candidatus Calditenuaceae archaeon HR02]|nr:hypothetical protein HRbin02_00695 [Candidatus Calditenuaceae archaeon HR02]